MIRIADFDDPRVGALFLHHARQAAAQTAAGSAHALDLSGLQRPDVTAWVMWDGVAVVATGALKVLSSTEGEVKAMHVIQNRRGLGLGSQMVGHIITEARIRGLQRLNLETGSWPFFAPAWALYQRQGFCECGPFGDYKLDPNSRFFTRYLA